MNFLGSDFPRTLEKVTNKSLCILGRPGEGSPGRKSEDYETALSSAGFGKFHYWLLFVCGWANASDAVEILCISFVLPAATCDFALTSEDKVS